jgi:AAA domain
MTEPPQDHDPILDYAAESEQPEHKGNGQDRHKITATPYVWRDPRTIPPRDFVYGYHYIRRYLSGTVSMGGVGKSSEISVEIAAMVTGRELIGVKPKAPLRVWYINLEDPRDEIDRRFAAIWKHYSITPMDIGDRLFIESGRENNIILARETKNGLVIAEPVVADIIETITTNQIDVVSSTLWCFQSRSLRTTTIEWHMSVGYGRTSPSRPRPRPISPIMYARALPDAMATRSKMPAVPAQSSIPVDQSACSTP